jgi:UDP-N-acetylglucosamine 2-epimerase (non-hydrolysing)
MLWAVLSGSRAQESPSIFLELRNFVSGETPLNLLHVVGARPNFMKVAPLMRALDQSSRPIEQFLVHTGQHYDPSMSGVFFEELDLPQPDLNLGVGSGTHTWQTAQVMLAFEPVLAAQKPDWVVVVGDVNSTLAAALVCSKMGVPLAHVEAGLRSFDRSMPEEINRLLTDQVADLLFTPSPEAGLNLLREGVASEKIHFVGNVMIDTLLHLLPQAEQRWPRLQAQYQADEYLLVTLHRPANVDEPEPLAEIMAALEAASRWLPVLFPVHPRTRKALIEYGLGVKSEALHLIEPLGYLDFLALQSHARLVLTDSGGIQEETTFLGVPCLTARPNTERPVTIEKGTNRLVASERRALVAAIEARLLEPQAMPEPPELWDGEAAGRIAAVLEAFA